MDAKQRFLVTSGSSFFLAAEQDTSLAQYLTAKGWLTPGEEILETEKPGEGNMNFVLRVKTNRNQFIIKQARPWVEKYPQIDAPIERIHTEANFYQLAQQHEILRDFTPKLLGTDPANYIMLLEDLGHGADFSHVYQKAQDFSQEELDTLISFLQHLHGTTFSPEIKNDFPKNQALKALNHEHIFSFPYRADNGLNLDDIQVGLQALAAPIYKDSALKKVITALGEVYLGEGSNLIHGDFYPGSWLKVAGAVKIIDPEFAYFGRAEFDLGVFLAHLKMAQSAQHFQDSVREQYTKTATFDDQLLDKFIGVEMLRRLIGIAQLPLALSIAEKASLVEESIHLLKK